MASVSESEIFQAYLYQDCAACLHENVALLHSEATHTDGEPNTTLGWCGGLWP